ncbi:hypothetical protein [Actinoplanes sp. ATCC 53533]|nr:hypothetical protein [Actinoplanes sp. ATCC 53533]
MDIDPHLSAWDNGQLRVATLPIGHDPTAGHCTWRTPLATLLLGARP